MIPIPTHLRSISQTEKTSETTTTVSLRCPCGCNRFFVHQNAFTAAQRKEMQTWQDAFVAAVRPYGYTALPDADGTYHYWKHLTPQMENGEMVEFTMPEMPFFAGITVVKIICADCGAETVLFDSRCHGYDGKTTSPESQVLAYVPAFRQKGKQAVTLEIKIENDSSLEAFRENTGLNYAMDEYADAFSYLWVYTINENGKRKKIFDFETA